MKLPERVPSKGKVLGGFRIKVPRGLEVPSMGSKYGFQVKVPKGSKF